ncbi:MAG: hypothetical protein ACOYNW_04035 [Undibacterium curvum]|uniref:hypothetical protein n=1 Tax=Undibacterium curvum TaxID=2762294 RepID=UPI003BDBCD11
MNSKKGKPTKTGVTGPSTYSVLQDSIEKQGAKSAQAFGKLSKAAQKAQLKEMQKFATSIRSVTNVPSLTSKQRSSLVTSVAGNNKRSFADAFRAVKPGHDEMLSTAQTYHMALGINSVKATKSNAQEMQQFMDLSLEMSHAARIKTEYVGFNYTGNQMQHPTRKGQGLFQVKQGQHNKMDRQRAQSSLEHVTKKKKLNEAMIPIELVRASMINTTNQMMAPTTASNQTLNKLSAEKPKAAFSFREKIKDISRGSGFVPTQSSTTQKANSPWQKRDDRSPSPTRK